MQPLISHQLGLAYLGLVRSPELSLAHLIGQRTQSSLDTATNYQQLVYGFVQGTLLGATYDMIAELDGGLCMHAAFAL